jgi:D-alanyl-D-alanine carboxypeptidase
MLDYQDCNLNQPDCMSKTSFIFPIAFVLLVFLFGSCEKKKETVTPANQALITQLDHWGDSVTQNLLIDSVNLSVQGAIIYVNDPVSGLAYERSFGTSDVTTARYLSLKSTDFFRIGTLTNTFTSTVFLQLVQNGVLNLDDKLNKFYPEVPNSDNITLRQIANMTSGLFDYTETDTIHKIWATAPLTVLLPHQLLMFALADTPYFSPGTGCRYSCTNSVLMGLISENVTGNTLSEIYRDKLFSPLNLDETIFPVNQFMPFYQPFSHGYEYLDTTHILTDLSERYDPSWAWGSANLISYLPDIRIWLQAFVKGTLLSPSIQQERMNMVDWQTVHGIPLQYGLGIMGTSGYYGHLGDIMGYHSICMYAPSTGATIIVMMNNGSGSPLLMFANIANLLSPGLIPVSK